MAFFFSCNFRLFELLLSESQLLDTLSGLGIEASAYLSLLTMPVHGSGLSEVVLDVRNKVVVVSCCVSSLFLSLSNSFLFSSLMTWRKIVCIDHGLSHSERCRNSYK